MSLGNHGSWLTSATIDSFGECHPAHRLLGLSFHERRTVKVNYYTSKNIAKSIQNSIQQPQIIKQIHEYYWRKKTIEAKNTRNQNTGAPASKLDVPEDGVRNDTKSKVPEVSLLKSKLYNAVISKEGL